MTNAETKMYLINQDYIPLAVYFKDIFYSTFPKDYRQIDDWFQEIIIILMTKGYEALTKDNALGFLNTVIRNYIFNEIKKKVIKFETEQIEIHQQDIKIEEYWEQLLQIINKKIAQQHILKQELYKRIAQYLIYRDKQILKKYTERCIEFHRPKVVEIINESIEELVENIPY